MQRNAGISVICASSGSNTGPSGLDEQRCCTNDDVVLFASCRMPYYISPRFHNVYSVIGDYYTTMDGVSSSIIIP